MSDGKLQIKKPLDKLARVCGFKPENKAAGKCIQCGKDGIENCYSSLGKREFAISGLCEYCFDNITTSGRD